MSDGASQIPVTGPAASPREVGRKERLRRWLLVLALLATVIAVDQAAKWWAWRHIPGANINPGGDFLTGPMIGRWYANPVCGALLDLMSCGLVSIAVAVLARRRRPAAVNVCGSLMVGGWASNLLDRLGMHYLTAPGSIRGAVDFIGIRGYSWNLADFFIVGATALFLFAAAYPANRPAADRATPAPLNSSRARVPIVAVAGAALITTVALGATHDGTLARPFHARLTPGRSYQHARLTPGRSYQKEMAPDDCRNIASGTKTRRSHRGLSRPARSDAAQRGRCPAGTA